jgi:hypothetical protein
LSQTLSILLLPTDGEQDMVEWEYIKARGRALGLDRFLLQSSKRMLVQAIQRAEGHAACFRDDNRYLCEEIDCEWRSECLKLTAAWRR